MTTENFGVGELIYDPQIYDKVNQFNVDFNFYYNLAKDLKGKVLELCCGTGRLTIPLKEKGIDISGVDYKKSMLEEAKKKALEKNLKIDFTFGDMKNLDLNGDEKYEMIFIPYNSIQNTYTIEDISNIFSSVAKYLKDDGIFVFDIFNPSIELLVDSGDEFKEFTRFKLDNGEEVIVTEKSKYDSATQTQRVIWRHTIGGKVFDQKLDMRCFYPQEMDLHILYNNFKIIAKFGDFDSNKFNSESMKQIYICKKRI